MSARHRACHMSTSNIIAFSLDRIYFRVFIPFYRGYYGRPSCCQWLGILSNGRGTGVYVLFRVSLHLKCSLLHILCYSLPSQGGGLM